MPPSESATHMSRVRRGVNSASVAISDRRRMKPTCGPLPWVRTTRQPSATRAPTCAADARADLADARFPMGDARVEHGRYAAVNHAPRVDAHRNAGEAEGGNAVVVV